VKIITEELVNKKLFRSYLFFWVGQLFSVLGSAISQFTIIWWINDTTGSTMLLSLAAFCYMLPMTIVIALAGVVIDRWNRKTIIIVVDSLQAYVMLIIIILFNFGVATPITVVIIMSLLGLFQGFHIPTVAAIVPTMVPKDKLSRMNGVNFFFTSFIHFIGPIIAAMLMVVIPLKFVLWIDPITFIIALIPLLFIKIPKIEKIQSSEEKNSFIKDFRIGFRTLKLIPIVLLMLTVSMFVNFLIRPYSIFLPYFIKYNHSGDAATLALVLAFMNGGMILGALIASIKKEWKHSISFYFGGELTLMLMYGVIALTPHGFFLLMSIAASIFGLAIPIINTIYLTMMQKKIPADKMGRISSIDWAISSAISPIGTLIAWPLSEIFGVPNLFLIFSIIGIIITLLLWWIAHTRVNNFKKTNEIEELGIDKFN
jgi:DHA3 family macrolide efflux protein-like MFS transporter